MFTLVNINTLAVLVLKCLVILYGHKCSGIVANVVAQGYSVGKYLSCGRCMPLSNYAVRYHDNVAIVIATVAEICAT